MKENTGYLTFRVTFSAMHELGNPKLSPAENKKIFGKCYKTHGHNYFLEATVRGPINTDSGLCCDREAIHCILEKEVVKKYDGQHLNKIFKSTSGEDLVREFYQILTKQIPGLVMIRLQETPKNFFTYGAAVETAGKTPETFNDFRFLMY